jgi:Zn-dependent M28 family amino/carboxypeptidase
VPRRDGRVLPLQALDLIALLATALALAAPVPAPTVDRFDANAAWNRLVAQVRLGPRPAGSVVSRRLSAKLKAELPRGSYQLVPGGLRNVVGFVRGRDPSSYVVVAAHYDTKDIPGFVGANDGAGGTAVLVQLARTIKPRTIGPSVVFLALDGEETPAGVPDAEFLQYGIRGAKVAAPLYRKAQAMILLDFVANKNLVIPREGFSDRALWAKLRRAAARVGVGSVFPDRTSSPVEDDHYPFVKEGVPSIDLIDFDFPCWHRTCDDLSAVSMRSIDAVGETMVELLRSF